MKQLKYFLILFLVPMMAFAFTGCSSDDDDNDGGKKSSSSIVGTWRYNFSTGYQIVTFNSNGTGSMREHDNYDGMDYTDYFRYSYNKSAGFISVIYDDDDIEYYTVRSVTSSELIVIDEDGDTIRLVRIGN